MDDHESLDGHSIPDNIEGGPYRPSPEDFAPQSPKPLGPLQIPPKGHSLQLALLLYAACLGVSMIYWRSPYGKLLPISGQTFFGENQYWRALSALFVHADIGHLMSNGPMFLIFGWYLHAYFGSKTFPFMALILGVLTNIFTAFANDARVSLVGASGMVYAMVSLWLVLYVRHDVQRPVTVRIVRGLAFSLVVMFPSTFRPEVSYLAHGIGFALGIVMGLITMNHFKPTI